MNEIDAILAEDITNAESFRKLRQKMGLTQYQLAKLLSVSIPTLSRMEIGKNRIHMRTAMAMKLLYLAYKRFTDGMQRKPNGNEVYKMLFGVLYMNTFSNAVPNNTTDDNDEQTATEQPTTEQASASENELPSEEGAAPQPA